MSTWIIEEQSGRYTGTQHPHNGYYAGDFSGSAFAGGFSPFIASGGNGAAAGTTSTRL